MWRDPIVDEVHSQRDAYAKAHGYDLARIGQDLMDLQGKLAAAKVAKKPSKPASPTGARKSVAKSRKRSL